MKIPFFSKTKKPTPINQPIKDIEWTAEEKHQLQEIYKDAYGNKYFQLKDLTRIALKRSIAAEGALRTAEFCMTKKKLLEICTEMKKCVQNGDLTLLFSMVQEMENRAKFAAEEETLLQLAHVYIYLENEPINSFATHWQERKTELWKRDDDALNFFLELAWMLTRQYNNMSDLNILTYLREIKGLEKEIKNYFYINT